MVEIGLLNEHHLHAELKQYLAQPGDLFEAILDRYVIDIIRGPLLIEIQTRNFASIKEKLAVLVNDHQIRVVFPLTSEKWIVKLNDDANQAPTCRKSPKKGRIEDVFREMIRIPNLVSHANFSLEILFIQEKEIRKFIGKRRWRNRGWANVGRKLVKVLNQQTFSEPSDWIKLLPPDIEQYTVKDLQEKLDISKDIAQKMAYFYHKSQISEFIGKKGHAHLYQIKQ